MVNKKGWMKIVEVFVAILLIMAVILIIIERDDFDGDGLDEKVYEEEISVLIGIESNSTLRGDILGTSVPVLWDDFDTAGLSRVKERINSDIPGYLECRAKLCGISDACTLNEDIEKDVYSKSATIFANLAVYNPRKLKLFCWEK